MTSLFSKLGGGSPQAKPKTAEAVLGFQHGLRTSLPPSMIALSELAECKNMQVNRGGQLQSRPGMTKLNAITAGQEIISLGSAVVEGVNYKYVQLADLTLRKVSDTGVITDESMITLAKKCQFIDYGAYLIVLDGGFVKYIDTNDDLRIAWDGGKAGQFDNLSDESDGQTDMQYSTDATTNIQTFVTEDWPTDFGILPTKLEVKVAKAGAGPVSQGYFRIYRTSDDYYMGGGPITEALAPAPGDFITVTIAPQEFFAPNTSYYVQYYQPTWGDLTNYLIWYKSGSDHLLRVYPAVPPKASFGVVHGRRLWVTGNAEELSNIYFSNYSLFDWSTDNVAGYLTAVDFSKDSFPVGAMVPYYNSLFVYGTKERPFLLQVTGESSADFVINDLSQPLWSRQSTTVNIVNDVWALSQTGMASLVGVNLYGDVRSFSESMTIEDLVESLFDDDTEVGFYVERGQVWVTLGSRVLVAHSKVPVTGETRMYYPWTEYTFPFDITAMGKFEDLTVGTADGFIYVPDTTTSQDDGAAVELSVKTKYLQSAFNKVDVLDIKVLLETAKGLQAELQTYKNMLTIPDNTWTLATAISDTTIIDDFDDVTIAESELLINPASAPLVQQLGFRCWAYQIELTVTELFDNPTYLNGFVIRYRPMED